MKVFIPLFAFALIGTAQAQVPQAQPAVVREQRRSRPIGAGPSGAGASRGAAEDEYRRAGLTAADVP